ncbi:hypothetical protein E2C01_078296 [Portunus trituberculatus]|uniref:Uncharacterized protein n=1 Tax=Portunus trituberculatus TaxID=210409 RepID=A0A5B7ITS4_PORTR|nr:hypothetical protein [Portunus trituberculatus]
MVSDFEDGKVYRCGLCYVSIILDEEEAAEQKSSQHTFDVRENLKNIGDDDPNFTERRRN